MRLVKAAGALCAVVFCFQAVLAQPSDTSLPPEDLDSSGDDDDSFSGSGAGPLPAHPVVAWNVPLQESTNISLKPEVSTDLRENQPEVYGTDSPTEDYARISVSPTSRIVFPIIDLVPDKPVEATTVASTVVAVEEDDLDLFPEQPATRSTMITAGIPAIHHHVSTVRMTTSRASSTSRVIETEESHNNHYLTGIDEENPAFGVVPTRKGSLDITSPTTASTAVSTTASTTVSSGVHGDSSSLSESEDGSGDEKDFIFVEDKPVIPKESGPNNRAMDIEANDAKSEGAPQGILDRKEVLGGVIAGGLVGLLFAVFLVGFMLYRMKKKDEGSYSLDEPKQSNGGYQKPHKQEEFYA
ncbi:syndecan-1 [Elgaria multicarinata webbii]|uniref:syndecan-1 n=1 Tax=Elgaria multicarinata webbii TaxID=159646 RepID=UPI002FCD252D